MKWNITLVCLITENKSAKKKPTLIIANVHMARSWTVCFHKQYVCVLFLGQCVKAQHLNWI